MSRSIMKYLPYTTITVFAPVFAPASQSPGLPARPLASCATATPERQRSSAAGYAVHGIYRPSSVMVLYLELV